MYKFAESVIEFQEKILGIPKPEKGLEKPAQVTWLMNALREEIDEYDDAVADEDYIGAVDALIDLLYFAIGGLHRMGLSADDMAICGQIVHRANLRKKKGIVEKRGDGTVADAVKTEVFVSPEDLMRHYLGVG